MLGVEPSSPQLLPVCVELGCFLVLDQFQRNQCSTHPVTSEKILFYPQSFTLCEMETHPEFTFVLFLHKQFNLDPFVQQMDQLKPVLVSP